MKKKPVKSKAKKLIKRKPKKAKTRPEVEEQKEPVTTSTSYVENKDFNFEIISIELPDHKPIKNLVLKSVKSNFRKLLSKLRTICGRGGEEENSI